MKKPIKIRFKRLSDDAQAPFQGSAFASGYDLTATSKTFDQYGNTVFGTGIAVEIPENYTGFLFPRSSNAKKDVRLTNCVGVIDSDYRGEIKMKFRSDLRILSFKTRLRMAWQWFVYRHINLFEPHIFNIGANYEVGDRIGQLIILPKQPVDFVESDELSETERGIGGYGSTGK